MSETRATRQTVLVALFVGMVTATLSACAAARAHDPAVPLPEGPVKERIELMERMGKNARKVGDSLRANDLRGAAAAATEISEAILPFLELFPEGVTDPQSRAKIEIWSQRQKFEKIGQELKKQARAFAAAANAGGDLKGASGPMWAQCKSCHDAFRIPKDDE